MSADAEGRGVNSSLGLPALWRWVELLERLAQPDVEEVESAVRIARPILESPAAKPLISFGVLPSLPQLEERILGSLSILAWHHLSHEMGQGFLVDFLTVSREEELTPAQQEIYDEVVAQGWASRDRLDLLRAQRLAALGSHQTASDILTRLTTGPDGGNRVSAILALVRLQMDTVTGSGSEQRELLTRVVDGAKDPLQRQEALYLRALLQSGAGRQADLRRLLEDQPDGPWADDAIFRLALWDEGLWSAERTNRAAWDSAQELYAELRAFPGENDWQDSAYFRPALDLYTVGGEENLRRAEQLLAAYRREVPAGAFRILAEFWRARALEELGKTAQAAEIFEQIAAEEGYGYYGLRSRMHLESGAEAARQLWPDPEVRRQIREAYAQEAGSGFEEASPYHARLAAATDSGLYAALLDALVEVGRRFPGRRLPTISLDELDSSGLLTPVVVLLSLRQDALAAAHWGDSVPNHIRVQTAVGYGAGDWPVAMSMAIGAFDEYQGGASLPGREGFLHAAYPPVYKQQIETAAKAWRVPPEFLYAMMRRESLFSPTAHSRAGALGLFQFMPGTFDRLDGDPWRWNLLAAANVDSRAEYLLDGDRSLDLGARYLGRALMREWLCRLQFERGCVGVSPQQQPELPAPADWFDAAMPQPERLVPLLALLEHSKGYRDVSRWRETWARAGREGDFEYMIETVGSTEARILSRGVLADVAVVHASDLFGGE